MYKRQVSTNTFGINGLKYSQQEIETLVGAAVSHVKAARMQAGYTESERYVALDVGPTGKMLKPLGDLDFEKAVAAFQAVIKVGAAHGVDLIFIETMNDSLETKAAVLAAKESCDLPVFVTTVYDETGKLMTGAGPEAMVALLEGLRADAIGLNCSLGPEQMKPVVERLAKVASVPLIVKPNAGPVSYTHLWKSGQGQVERKRPCLGQCSCECIRGLQSAEGGNFLS